MVLVKVPASTILFLPSLTAIALIVVVALTAIGVLYSVDFSTATPAVAKLAANNTFPAIQGVALTAAVSQVTKVMNLPIWRKSSA